MPSPIIDPTDLEIPPRFSAQDRAELTSLNTALAPLSLTITPDAFATTTKRSRSVLASWARSKGASADAIPSLYRHLLKRL